MSRTSARRVVPSSCRRRITRDRASVASAPLCARERVPVERTARDYGGPGKRARRGRRDTRLPHRRVNAILKPSCTPGQRLSPLARSTLQLSFSLSLSPSFHSAVLVFPVRERAMCVCSPMCVRAWRALYPTCMQQPEADARERERERAEGDGRWLFCRAPPRRAEPRRRLGLMIAARSLVDSQDVYSEYVYLYYVYYRYACVYEYGRGDVRVERERERERTSREDE